MAVDRERRHQKHRQEIMKKYEGICHLCGDPYADSIDHVVPVAIGGSDHPDNLRPAHTSCNSSKGARSYPKWAEEQASMWMPGYEPEPIKQRKREAAAARRLREEKAAATRRKQVDEHNVAVAAWEDIEDNRRNLLAERPERPSSKPAFNGDWLSYVGFVFGVVAVVAVIWWRNLWPLWDQDNWGSDVLLLILVGVVAYWIAVIAIASFVTILIAMFERTFLRSRFRQYTEDLASWQIRMDDFNLNYPREPKPRLPWEDEKSKPRSSTPRVYPKSRRRYRSRGYYRGYRRF